MFEQRLKVDIVQFIVQFLGMLIYECISELDSLLKRVIHVLDQNELFPNFINKVNDFVDWIVFDFVENELKKLTEFVLSFQIDDKHFFLFLWEWNCIFSDHLRQGE